MRDQHKGRTEVAGQLQHQFKHTVGRDAIQIARWLVGQHASRLRNQCTRNRDALAFAA
jgi:hypothetical protein